MPAEFRPPIRPMTKPCLITRVCLLAGCLICLPGCGILGAGGGVSMWAVSDSVAVFPDAAVESENAVFNKADATIRLAGALNETISFQLILRSDGPAGVRRITASDLQCGPQSIAANQFRLYRQHRVRATDYPTWYLRMTPYLRAPRSYPDVLVPLDAPEGGLPISLKAGASEAVWVDIQVPATSADGVYTGDLTVDTMAGSRQTLKIALEVHPFSLPSARHLAVLCGVDVAMLLDQQLPGSSRSPAPNRLGPDDPDYERAVALVDAAAHLLHEHRCTPLLKEVAPLRRWDAAGQLHLDWTNYDRLVGSIVDGSMFADRSAAPVWPIPLPRQMVEGVLSTTENSGNASANLTSYLNQCAEHFAELGWLDRNFVWFPEPGPGWSAAMVEQLGGLLREADPRLRLVGPLPPQPLGPLGDRTEQFRDLSDVVRIWAPRADVADRAALLRQRDVGRTSWLRPDHPPYSGTLSLLGSPIDARTLAWQAFRFGCEGILIDQVNAWGENAEPAVAGSERCLIWPGKPFGLTSPVPSIRLKRLARGIQDYSYLWLLVHNRRAAIAEVIAEDLFAYGGTGCYGEHLLDGRAHGWVTQPHAWALARKLMAAELLLALREQESRDPVRLDQAEQLKNKVEWARLTETTRSARLEVDGVRLPPQPFSAEGPLTAQAAVAVFNHGLQALQGAITLQQAPAGWSIPGEPVRIEGLASTRQTRHLVPITIRDLLPTAYGMMPFEIGLDAQVGPVRPGPARFCLLNAIEMQRPLEIDGKLDEWPLGAGNTAGDFLLVGATDVPKTGRASPDRPSQGTTVFVCHDRQSLIIGFLCLDDRLGQRVISRNNLVSYDELWPTGEDLVEVIMDPTGKAVSPADLLHIVVKANGAVIVERGFACLDRIAAHEPVSGLVKAAVNDRAHANRWTAELCIDLAGLPGRAEIMGINFGRFLPRLGEYSSWSGARRNLYSPTCLGHVRLPLD